MINKLLGVLAATLCVGGIAQAQTVTIVDQTYSVPTLVEPSFSFNVTSPDSLFIEGAAISTSTIAGLGFLTGPGGFDQTFALTNGSVLTSVFNTYTLNTPGEYTFKFDFANQLGIAAGQVGVTATLTTPVPEPQTYAMLMAGLLVVGFTTRRRLFARS